MGGTDDPSNLVEVTLEQHIALHKQLWEDLGQWQDYAAWQGLSGRMGKEELIRFVQSQTHKGIPKTDEHRRKLSIAAKKRYEDKTRHPMFGKHKEENPNYGKTRPKHSKRMSGKNNPMSAENRMKRSMNAT